MNGQKKRLLIIGLSLVGLTVLIIVFLLIFHALTKKDTSYEALEERIITATKNYYSDNESRLPKEGQQVTIKHTELVKAGYLKELSEYTNDDTCNAEVVVSNSDSNYRYTVLLNCSDNYNTKTLVSHIIKEGTVNTGIGLYKVNGEYIYRGETPNNYVKFSNRLYRIVKITDNKLLLILNDKLKTTYWDNRYNIERKYSDGINDYTVSRIREALPLLDLVKDSDKQLLEKQTLYIGKRGYNDSKNDGSLEKKETLKNEYYGLLPLYDYINASIDENCKSAATRSCSNYNYLNKYDYNWWTITSDTETTYKVYRVADTGEIDLVRANSTGYIRPIIMLKSDSVYVSGDGSLERPYIVK